MPIGHSNAMWQCKWLKLVGKFATNASSAILWPIFQLMQWCHLVAKFGTNASDAIWWPIFQLMQLMQVAPSCGQFFNSCKWRHLVAKFGTNASGATISWRDNSSSDAIPWVRCASGNVYTIKWCNCTASAGARKETAAAKPNSLNCVTCVHFGWYFSSG